MNGNATITDALPKKGRGTGNMLQIAPIARLNPGTNQTRRHMKPPGQLLTYSFQTSMSCLTRFSNRNVWLSFVTQPCSTPELPGEVRSVEGPER
jgi:hypothetical protein